MTNLKISIFLLCLITLNQKSNAAEDVKLEQEARQTEENAKFIEGLGYMGNEKSHNREFELSTNSFHELENNKKFISKRSTNEETEGENLKRSAPYVKFRIENPTLYNIAQNAFRAQLQANMNNEFINNNNNQKVDVKLYPESRILRNALESEQGEESDDANTVSSVTNQLKLDKRCVKKSNNLDKPGITDDLQISNRVNRNTEESDYNLNELKTIDEAALKKQLEGDEVKYFLDKPATNSEFQNKNEESDGLSAFERQLLLNKRYIKGSANKIMNNNKKKRELKKNLGAVTTVDKKYQEEKALLEGITEGTVAVANDTKVKRNDNVNITTSATEEAGTVKGKRDVLSTQTIITPSTVIMKATSNANYVTESENKQLEKSYTSKLEKRDTSSLNRNTSGTNNDPIKKISDSARSTLKISKSNKVEATTDNSEEDEDEDDENVSEDSNEFSEKRSNVNGLKHWDHWSAWSKCSVSCGIGKITRWRHCKSGACEVGEKEAQIKTCTQPACL